MVKMKGTEEAERAKRMTPVAINDLDSTLPYMKYISATKSLHRATIMHFQSLCKLNQMKCHLRAMKK